MVVGAAALITLRIDEPKMFDRFVDRSVVLLALAALVVVGAIVRMARARVEGARAVAALGIALAVASWGVAQYPYLLPFDLTIDAGAGSSTTARWVLVWFAVAVVTVIPMLVLLYVLDQRGELVESEASTDDGDLADLMAVPAAPRAHRT
jgi:cytochrome d ubiquinol oxidase subunit II